MQGLQESRDRVVRTRTKQIIWKTSVSMILNSTRLGKALAQSSVSSRRWNVYLLAWNQSSR